MGRGLLTGAMYSGIATIGFLVIATVFPMWMVLRSELEQSMCWQTEGEEDELFFRKQQHPGTTLFIIVRNFLY